MLKTTAILFCHLVLFAATPSCRNPAGRYQAMNPAITVTTLHDGTRIFKNVGTTWFTTDPPQDRRIEVRGEISIAIPAFSICRTTVAVRGLGDLACYPGMTANIRNYAEDSLPEVTILHGSAQLEMDSTYKEYLIQAGSGIRLDRGQTIHLSAIDSGDVPSWITGRPTFHGVPISVILNSFRRNFNQSIVYHEEHPRMFYVFTYSTLSSQGKAASSSCDIALTRLCSMGHLKLTKQPDGTYLVTTES